MAVAVVTFVEMVVTCYRRTSRLSREIRMLTVLSGTDSLTGLPNRRHIEEHLAVAGSAARRHGQPLSLLFIDIDSFKRVNDESGYEAGDEVLWAVGDRVRVALRAEDVVGRWGGEEFVAVLPTTDLPGALSVAERIREAVAEEVIPIENGDVSVTVSIGCASGGADDPSDLIRQASHAVREAKAAGKNQVVAAAHPCE
jgi:diguanylate cyclase (GGDEF)-like protein